MPTQHNSSKKSITESFNNLQDAVKVSNLSYRYTDAEVDGVLKDINLSIAANEIVALVGRSGCGKTTLLRLIAGMLEPTSGCILVSGMSPSKAASIGNSSILFQHPVLLPWRTVLSNIALPLELTKLPSNAVSPAGALLAVGLTKFRDHYPYQLSGGMQQRVALARAIVCPTKLLLLDEPFAALDEFSREEMSDLFLRLHQQTPFAALFVTHTLAEAALIADRVLILGAVPRTITHEEHIPFQRPRERSLLEKPDFYQCITRIRREVY